MLSTTIGSALNTIIPFLGGNIVKLFSIENDPNSVSINIAVSMIIGELIKIGTNYLDETNSIMLIILCVLLFIIYFIFNNYFYSIQIFKKPKTVTLTSYENDSVNTVEINYSIKMNAINKFVIEKYKDKNTKYYNFDTTTYLDNVDKLYIENDIILSVSRKNNNVIYVLKSYYKNIDDFIDKLVELYNYKYCVELEGNLLTKIFTTTFLNVTNVLINKYNFTDYTIEYLDHNIKNQEKNNSPFPKISYPETDNLLNNTINNNSILLLKTCNNLKIKNDIYIDVYRKKDTIYYKIYSNVFSIKQFIDECNKIQINSVKISMHENGIFNIYMKSVLYFLNKNNIITQYRTILCRDENDKNVYLSNCYDPLHP
jgi:hypothetical protein